MSLPDPRKFEMKMEKITQQKCMVSNKQENDKAVLLKIAEEIGKLDSHHQTFSYQPYREECLEIAPLWLYQEASSRAIGWFKNITVWDEKNKTIIFLVYDYYDELISYKRRRFRNGKWITRKSTHPNNQCIMRCSNPYGPIYVIEGHHDALCATLLDIDDVDTFNFIMIPTVSYREFGEEELSMIFGRDVFFLPDLGDNNNGSIKGMTCLAEQIESYASNVRIVNMEAFLLENKIEVHQEKLDLAEALFLWKEGTKNFINCLHYYCDRGIVFDGEAF